MILANKKVRKCAMVPTYTPSTPEAEWKEPLNPGVQDWPRKHKWVEKKREQGERKRRIERGEIGEGKER